MASDWAAITTSVLLSLRMSLNWLYVSTQCFAAACFPWASSKHPFRVSCRDFLRKKCSSKRWKIYSINNTNYITETPCIGVSIIQTVNLSKINVLFPLCGFIRIADKVNARKWITSFAFVFKYDRFHYIYWW